MSLESSINQNGLYSAIITNMRQEIENTQKNLEKYYEDVRSWLSDVEISKKKSSKNTGNLDLKSIF